MAEKAYLLLRLEGPLQSWGTRSRWDVRDSGDEPTKSGLVGLLGCALGYPVGDERLAALERSLVLGVRVENPGRKMVDFQTVTGIHLQADGDTRGSATDPRTIISPREYLQDAAFLAVFAGPVTTIRTAAAALQSPRWPVYLGRKSCPPTRPIFEGVIETDAGMEDTLRKYPWEWSGAESLRGKYPTRLSCQMDDPAGSAQRSDRILTNPARMYGYRRVRVFEVDFPGLQKEVAETCTSRVCS